MVWGISIVKDEVDIISSVVGHMSHHCDAVLVADNGSTDGTYEALQDIVERQRRTLDLPISPRNVNVIRDFRKGYYQSHKMTALAHLAGNFGAEWIVPFDADEKWFPVVTNLSIAQVCRNYSGDVIEANLHNYKPVKGSRGRFLPSEPGPLPKVAFRWRPDAVIEQGNHGVLFSGKSQKGEQNLLTVAHFPCRSPEQFIRKIRNGAAAYEAAPDVPEGWGVHWREFGKLSDDELRQHFEEEWWATHRHYP
jgi:hypothetical protein